MNGNLTEPRDEIVLELKGLTKKYRNGRGIENVSLQVRRGDIYGFFGPNGSGKTTAMKAIVRLSRADRGTAVLFGNDVAERYEQAMKRTGTMIEAPAAYDYMSACRNLELALRYYPEIGRSRIGEVLELTGLAPYAKEKVGNFSLGMKQKLGLASALLSRPELLILDEPTNGLDIESMADMRELMRRLAREEKITFFLSSHLVHEMETLCNRVGILYKGNMIAEGAMPELLAEAGSLEAYFLERIRHERSVENVCMP
ncbi:MULTISPECIES: ABC transporter ATP-binding protein [Cohnella]|uniref:ABC transporter ATP-binding protein n=1 Tax=Cohnella TaxID=329857 RepID=UPI001FE5DD6D|nr:ABC transporter ATP-binding protein [Cohnella massiliensis]